MKSLNNNLNLNSNFTKKICNCNELCLSNYVRFKCVLNLKCIISNIEAPWEERSLKPGAFSTLKGPQNEEIYNVRGRKIINKIFAK